MSPSDYLTALASQLGFAFTPRIAPFVHPKAKCKGTILGQRQGYVVTVSLTSTDNDSDLLIGVRYPRITATESVREAINSIPGIKTFAATKRVQVGEANLVVTWPFAVRKPDQGVVVELIDNILQTIATFAPPFERKCEKCQKNPAGELVIYRHVPVFHCERCQAEQLVEQKLAAEEYSKSPVQLGKASLVSALVGLACAIPGAGLIYWFSNDNNGIPARLLIVVTVAIVMAVGHVFAKNIGRIELLSQAPIVVAIALSSVFFAELLNCVWMTMHYLQATFSISLLALSAKNLLVSKTTPGLDIFVTFLQLLSTGVSVEMLKRAKPKFIASYQTLSAVSVPTAKSATA